MTASSQTTRRPVRARERRRPPTAAAATRHRRNPTSGAPPYPRRRARAGPGARSPPPAGPSTSAARKVGASAQTAPPTMRRAERSVSRVAANQPPSTARGSARIHRSTTANDGAAGHRLPSTAITPANGSAGPTTSSAEARSPYAASAHSAPTVSRSGSRAPPPSTGHASSEVKATSETTSSGEYGPRASPGEEPQFASAVQATGIRPVVGASRSRSCVRESRSGAMRLHGDVRCRRRAPRDRAIEGQRTAAVNAAPHSRIARLGALRDDVREGAPERQGQDRQPVQGHQRRMRVGEAPVQLCGPLRVGASPDAATARAPRAGPPRRHRPRRCERRGRARCATRRGGRGRPCRDLRPPRPGPGREGGCCGPRRRSALRGRRRPAPRHPRRAGPGRTRRRRGRRIARNGSW